MFTKNNNILVDHNNEQNQTNDEFSSIPLEKLDKTYSSVSVLLPYGINPFYAYIKRINVIDVKDLPVVKLTFINTQGKTTSIECDPQNTKIFARYNNFIKVSDILSHNLNFAGQDILGFPLKLIKVEQTLYTGKMYDIITRRVNNIAINGILCNSDGDDSDKEINKALE